MIVFAAQASGQFSSPRLTSEPRTLPSPPGSGTSTVRRDRRVPGARSPSGRALPVAASMSRVASIPSRPAAAAPASAASRPCPARARACAAAGASASTMVLSPTAAWPRSCTACRPSSRNRARAGASKAVTPSSRRAPPRNSVPKMAPAAPPVALSRAMPTARRTPATVSGGWAASFWRAAAKPARHADPMVAVADGLVRLRQAVDVRLDVIGHVTKHLGGLCGRQLRLAHAITAS